MKNNLKYWKKRKRKREKTKIQEKKKIHEKNIVWYLVGRIGGHLVGMEFETKRANGIKEKYIKSDNHKKV